MLTDFVQALKHEHVQHRLAVAAIESFYESVLRWFPWFDELQHYARDNRDGQTDDYKNAFHRGQQCHQEMLGRPESDLVWSKVPRRWLQDRYCALALLNYQPTRFQIIEQRLRPITRQSFPRTVRQMHLQQAFPFAPAEYLQLRHLRKIDVMLIAVTILGLP